MPTKTNTPITATNIDTIAPAETQTAEINIADVLENTGCYDPDPEIAKERLTTFLTEAGDIAKAETQGIEYKSENGNLIPIVENQTEGALLAIGLLKRTLEESFPKDKFPYHNIHHSIGVTSRALGLAQKEAETRGTKLTEQEAITIILIGLGHDIIQNSDIHNYAQEITLNSEDKLDPKATIKRETGNNEVASIETLSSLLSNIHVVDTDKPLIEGFNTEIMETGIMGTQPEIAFTEIPSTSTKGLSIRQPELEEAITDYIKGGSFIPVAIMLSDLQYSFGNASPKVCLENGMNEFRELYQNIGRINKLLTKNPKIHQEQLEQMFADGTNINTIIDSVVTWIQGQSGIVQFQKHYMQQTISALRSGGKTEIANALTRTTPNYDSNAKYAEDQATELKTRLEEIKKEGESPVEQLKVALKYAGY